MDMVKTPETTAEQAKVTLYWLEQSRSQRILWLMEELKVPYELKTFHRDPKTHLAPKDSELAKVHPLGKSPVITVSQPGVSDPVIVAESANICEFLINHFGKETTLAPKQWKDGENGAPTGETEEWLRYRYFMHYAEGSLMTFMILAMVIMNIKNAPVPFFIKPITKMIASNVFDTFLNPMFATHFKFLEQQLETSPGGGKYICGITLSGADIMMSFPLIAGQEQTGLTKEKYPKLAAYIEMLQQEPGYKRAVEKIVQIEGKYEVMF